MRVFKQFLNFVKDDKKKNYLRITYEFFNLLILNREFPIHYFTRFAYRKDSGYYKDYLSLKISKKIWSSNNLHNLESCNLLRNKLKFEKFANSKGIKTTKTLFYNEKNIYKFLDNDKILEINNFDEFKNFIKTLNLPLFIKPLDGIQGRSCFKLKVDFLETDLNKIYIEIKDKSFLFQELIIQHEVINSIYKESINTLRVDTYKDKKNNVHILTPFLRIGRGGSITDNTSNSGFILPVDLETGAIGPFGVQYLNVSTDLLISHPDTNVVFADLLLPFKSEVKTLLKSIALATEDRLVGWDIAITSQGPIVVEGNCDYAMSGQDILNKGYKSNPIFRQILNENFIE